MVRLVAANFIASPWLMYVLLQIWPLDAPIAAGLAIYSSWTKSECRRSDGTRR